MSEAVVPSADSLALRERVAIVSGASRGIGRAVALELSRSGAAVVVNYRENEAAAAEVVSLIEGSGGSALAVRADVSLESDVKQLVGASLRRFGRIDVMVANAGIVRDRLAAGMSVQDWDAVIATNLRGPFLCVRECLPEMMRQKSGVFVLLSSVAAVRGGRGHCNYAASKGGINALVRSLAIELAPKRIRVNAVAPGVIETEMSERVREAAAEEILAKIPLRRYGTAQEVACAVRFLASPDAAYITGEVLHVTGGMEL